MSGLPDAPEGPGCPLPLGRYDQIVLGHGGGGTLTQALIEGLFLPAFGNATLAALEDQAACALPGLTGARLAISTDAFVVHPVFFPGGDIGRLAVYGTINDLAVGGASPLFLSAALILEEGLPMADLARLTESMAAACREVGVQLVAGDTKVVDRGKGDQIFITTTGVGLIPAGLTLSASGARPGDRLLVSGTLGDHGMAIMSVREGLAFETALESDCASLLPLTQALVAACPGLRCMRDPSRGGLASALNEIAQASGVGMKIREDMLPLRPEVRGACELLGLDPLYVANEGKLLAIVDADEADVALAVLRAHPLGREAAIVGTVVAEHPRVVTIQRRVGGERLLPMLAGEQLPRIC